MVEIILWSSLWGVAGVGGGFAVGWTVCKRRMRRAKPSTADSFLTLLRH